jgi:hypothetical protein
MGWTEDEKAEKMNRYGPPSEEEWSLILGYRKIGLEARAVVQALILNYADNPKTQMPMAVEAPKKGTGGLTLIAGGRA